MAGTADRTTTDIVAGAAAAVGVIADGATIADGDIAAVTGAGAIGAADVITVTDSSLPF